MKSRSSAGLFTLPIRSQIASRLFEQAKRDAAGEILALAAETRRAYYAAIGAQQAEQYLIQVRETAAAGAELARRLAEAGNWSRLQWAREQTFYAEVTAQLAIEIDMSDAMRFDPAQIDVKQGETIRFVVKNPGVLMHEMVLDTMVDLRSHSELMKKHPEMEHDEPYQAHVQSGTEGVMVWQFTQPGEFYYACLIPGHFEAGMFGKIVVAEK